MQFLVKVALAHLLAASVAGCGLYVPAKTFQSETPKPDPNYTTAEGVYENKIVVHLVCEVSNGIAAAEHAYNLPWLASEKWGTAITLTITAEDQSSVSPGLSFFTPFENRILTFPAGGNVTASQSFTLGVGGSVSANGTRTETIQFTLVNADLMRAAKLNPTCTQFEGGLMIDGDLKIKEFIYDKAVIAAIGNANFFAGKNPVNATQYPIYNTFTETINFVSTLSGNATPSWKLARFSDNTGAGNLFSAQRTYTNQAIITIGPLGTPPSETEAAALGPSGQTQHTTQVQGAATATAIRAQMGM